LSKIGPLGQGPTAPIKSGQMRKALIKLWWKQKHLDSLEPLGWRPSDKSNFANLQQLYSVVGNIKQSCSKIGYIEKLH